jgi:hypothetical protein
MENQTFAISNHFPKLSKIIRAILRHEIIATTVPAYPYRLIFPFFTQFSQVLPQMEDIPLPRIGKHELRDELKLDAIISQRWESEEVERKAAESAQKGLIIFISLNLCLSFVVAEQKRLETIILKEKAGARLAERTSKEEVKAKDTQKDIPSQPEVATPVKSKQSLRSKLFGPKKEKSSTTLSSPSKDEAPSRDAFSNLDDALTSFLGSVAGADLTKDKRTRAELVSDAATDVKNKVLSVLPSCCLDSSRLHRYLPCSLVAPGRDRRARAKTKSYCLSRRSAGRATQLLKTK